MFDLVKKIFLPKRYIFFHVIFLIINYSNSSFAQVFFSTEPDYLKGKKEKNNLLTHFSEYYPDTTLIKLSNFSPRNFMGNIGLPSPNYLINYGTNEIGFNLFQQAYSNDQFNQDQVTYYKTNGPYASLTGIAGSKELQIFKLLFAQTFKNRLNVGLKFNRYSSQGFYLKQQSYVNNIFFTTNFTSLNERFGFYGFILNNSNKNQENGGISNETLNDSTILIDKKLMTVKLSDATRNNQETQFMFNPWFRINKTKDSIYGNNHYLQLKSKRVSSNYKYKDRNVKEDKYYNFFNLDSNITSDSSNVKQWINDVLYVFENESKTKNISFGYRNEFNQIWQNKDSVFINHFIRGEVSILNKKFKNDSVQKIFSSFKTFANIDYIFSGPNMGNYKVEQNSELIINTKNKQKLFFNALYENRNPDYIYNNWISNHFVWQNNKFKSQQQFQALIGIEGGKLINGNFFYKSFNHFLYFDSLAKPQQYHHQIENIGFSITFSKLFFRHIGIVINHVYQKSTEQEYIRMPENISTLNLFYSSAFFHNNLQLQFGSQLQSYQSFSAYGYMPSTQVFYLQNESFKTQFYPFLDLYLNARIHPVSFFFKVENVLQGSVGNNYSFVKGYFQTDRAFRFGITWMFFD